MTAEQILKSAHSKLLSIPNNRYTEWEKQSQEPETKIIIEAMKEYASIKCAEQRQLCLDNASVSWENEDDGYLLNSETILNAPEPPMI